MSESEESSSTSLTTLETKKLPQIEQLSIDSPLPLPKLKVKPDNKDKERNFVAMIMQEQKKALLRKKRELKKLETDAR
jgi:hypothetical protein